MNILAIDTSNDVLGIAIQKDDKVVAEWMTHIKKDHSSRLMPAIVYAMQQVQMVPDQLDSIVVSQGPGSYTGTRIGVTTAKTLAWSLEKPIYPVSSLETLAYNGVFQKGYIVPFFDARRQTVFTALYYSDGTSLQLVKEETNMLMETWLEELIDLGETVMFLSPHLAIFQEMIEAKKMNHFYLPKGIFHTPRPSNMFMLMKTSEVAHTVTPNYLRITEAETNLLKQKKEQSDET